ncbi:DEAD/DEAH box helicase [Tetzosporium hominis]|nr:DEAD/DEAH box helicase family protein [Tetzosporium hominis]
MHHRHYFEGKIQPIEDVTLSQDSIALSLLEGDLDQIKGIEILRKSPFQVTFKCNRCLTQQPHHYATHYCLRCKCYCTYCRNCIRMGKITSCTQLFIWKGPRSDVQPEIVMTWKGTLSNLQQQALEEWRESIATGKSHMIHAVCGAGKTEIMFGAIELMLSRGERVAIACPRTDVILELAPRLQQAFESMRIDVLYGGSEKPIGLADLTLATTHQLYRFYRAFDHVIIDEADAFPYSADATLVTAVEKSLLPGGSIHYVSATPSKILHTDRKSLVAKRFHGHPLPVPRFQKALSYQKHLTRQKVPPALDKWIAFQIEMDRPFLIFFPTVRTLEDFPGNMERVHAEHPFRKELVQQLRDGKIKGLCTTTILERGITISNLQIAVLGAEQPIFNEQALIQIAGRAGRSAEFPTGDVVFFHNGVTEDMRRAKSAIERLNLQ